MVKFVTEVTQRLDVDVEQRVPKSIPTYSDFFSFVYFISYIPVAIFFSSNFLLKKM